MKMKKLATLAAPKRKKQKAKYVSPEIRSRFAKRISNLRDEYGLSQDELATYVGLHRTYISDLERGVSGISLDSLEVFAIAFRMPISELLRGV